jgi:prevent-host-death family protein
LAAPTAKTVCGASGFLSDGLYDRSVVGHTRVSLVFRTIKASGFKAKCSALIDQVAGTGDSIVITKNGKPLVKLAPHLDDGR